jgi:kynurenine formamidase
MKSQARITRTPTVRPYALVCALLLAAAVNSLADERRAGTSPWGADDEIGRLNLITEESRADILSRITGGKTYDLSVEYFIGMPSWQAAGDPHYRIWMTHTPHGTVIDDPLNLGKTMNEHVSYSGAAVSMYTHMGTHIDALNHFGLDGEIWNGFRADEHLGDRGWQRGGVENVPPIVARGVLIDVAAAKGVAVLPDNYRITPADLVAALEKQKTALSVGDVVLIRTGRMQAYNDTAAFMANPPGLGLDAARFLVEEGGAMIVGADNLSFESFPSELEDDYIPVHTYLLAEQGTPILELVFLEELSKDKIYEFAFIGGSLKLRGADAAPMRPIAIPVK